MERNLSRESRGPEMAFDPAFLELMQDYMGWQQHLGHDGFGNPTYSDSVTVQAHVDGVTAARGAPGDSEATEGPAKRFYGTVYTPVVGIEPKDRLTFPVRLDSLVQYVGDVNTLNDEDGPHHHEIQFSEKD
jgi:hypothetical protein